MNGHRHKQNQKTRTQLYSDDKVSDMGITNALNNRCAHQQENAIIGKVDIPAAVVASCAKAVPSRFRSPAKSFAAARTDCALGLVASAYGLMCEVVGNGGLFGGKCAGEGFGVVYLIEGSMTMTK
ncbi:hypothetical protein Tco_0559130 [Tanacetum coccineum]